MNIDDAEPRRYVQYLHCFTKKVFKCVTQLIIRLHILVLLQL